MKYFIDTEFLEQPCTIDLLSIAIVAEDGREYYAVNFDCDVSQANDFVRANVLPHLPEYNMITGHLTESELTKDLSDISSEILSFIGEDKPEFWGYYSDYDWVAFCWLFGAMSDLPKGWPMYCIDLKQALGEEKVPFEPEGAHHALNDARWIKKAHLWLDSKRTRDRQLNNLAQQGCY